MTCGMPHNPGRVPFSAVLGVVPANYGVVPGKLRCALPANYGSVPGKLRGAVPANYGAVPGKLRDALFCTPLR